MFSYYGAKTRVVDFYPKPTHNKIIEPFAGSARYSLKYFENDILLVDKYEVIVRIWKYLQECSVNDIMSLPKLAAGKKIIRENFDCIEQAWLMGFIISRGQSTPMLTVSKWGEIVFEKQRKFIAENLFKIKHWNIVQAEHTDLTNENATWFIDPPYQVGGNKYKFNNKKIDYNELAKWCKTRYGQIIVCENTNADWLDFIPVATQRGQFKTTTEVLWSNCVTNYNLQTALF